MLAANWDVRACPIKTIDLKKINCVEHEYTNTYIFVFCTINYSACRRRGGVLKCPRFCFFFGVESWAAAHGLYRCTVYRLLSEPMSTRLLNLISSRICRQNTQFNMYTTTSKQQEGCTFKDSHPKCFITTNFDKFHREAFARAVNRGDVLTACFRDVQSQRSIRMAFVIIMILFDVKDYRLLYGSISLSSEKIYT